MSNALQVYDKIQNAKDIENLGLMLGKSGVFGCERQEAGIVILMTCMAENISLVTYSRRYDTMMGKPSLKAVAVYADFRKAGAKIKWIADGDDGKLAKIEIDFEGNKTLVSYSIEDANRAGLVKAGGGWVKNPSAMLKSRVITKAVKMLCPEIYAGDDDEEVSYPMAKEINLDAPSSTLKPAAKETPMPLTDEKIIEVKTEVVLNKEDGVLIKSISDNCLSPETSGKLLEAVGDNFDVCIAWLVNQEWIKEGEGLMQLSQENADKILINPGPTRFVNAAKRLSEKK